MVLDEQACYRAVASRDPRFDGQFVMAVRTTGIYCRPSCPAITPKRDNVEFLPTAAAAQQRGYRACLRCRPDAAPGSPGWNVRGDVAARALRLIADGVVEREGVSGLAARLGYSVRHLNRVLNAELGAGPLALARAQRAHTARMLIETTALPMADVAFAAGFASVRQFNDTIRAVYGVPPSTLRADARRHRGGSAVTTTGGTLTLRLPFRAPFASEALLRFAADRTLDGVEAVVGDTYRRTLRLPHGPASVALAPNDSHVVATLRLADHRDLAPAVARLRRLLDLDADPEAVDDVLGADPALAASVVTLPGIRLPGSVDPTETALRAVIGQQISIAAARTIVSRLARALGERLPPELAGDGPAVLFPTAETVAERGGEVLTGPSRRVEAVLTLARAIAEGELCLDVGRDPAELAAELVALPGIGPWTAGYLAIRVLGTPDELLAGDLGVRRGAAALGLPSDLDALTAHARRWRPWRSYAAMHLWHAATVRTTAPAAPTTRRSA